GAWIVGLANGATYKIKAAALQGSATSSAFGPASASAATTTPSVTFGVTTSLTSTPPFAADFTSLVPGVITAANATITAAITTNAENGGQVLVSDQNAGLTSASKTHTINSTTADLGSAGRGYGA